MSKTHLHDEQFDGAPHPWCGRGNSAVSPEVFEATAPELRCKACDREWFPNGQPDWHLKAAQQRTVASSGAGQDNDRTTKRNRSTP
ncbi:MAG: hypothetical protein ACYC0T_21405 [Ramlibacter sp.]